MLQENSKPSTILLTITRLTLADQRVTVFRLARRLGVSVDVVEHALARLQAKGLVQSTRSVLLTMRGLAMGVSLQHQQLAHKLAA